MSFLLGAAVTVVLLVCLLAPKIREDVTFTRVEEDIGELKSLVEEYHGNTGSYPTTEQGLEALVSRPPGEPRTWRQVLRKLPADAWMNDYQYRPCGSGETAKFEIWSLGRDGIPGTKDDLSSLDP